MSERGYRTYEVYQRERVGQSTPDVGPRDLRSDRFLLDPYPTLAILREQYPCYRDWGGNAFWISRYDDVTSVIADDANYETRPQAWFLGLEGGRDLCGDPAVASAWSGGIESNALGLAETMIERLVGRGRFDLARDLAAPFPIELLVRSLDLPNVDRARLAERYWQLHLGTGWEPAVREAGRIAAVELAAMFDPLVEHRRADPGPDLLSAVATAEVEGGPTRGADVVATLLEVDHRTIHGTLANLWFLLLTHPDQLMTVSDDPRSLKSAWLESLRHSPPVLTAMRYTRHEVERFGRLLPEGALVRCSAAAANRDPRVFADPDRFDIERRDLTQREARGQHRADGLASAISVGTGPPSQHPAVPEDRPRSLFAITRDVVVGVSRVLLDATHDLRVVEGAEPSLRSLRLDEMRTCWSLPVECRPA
ncbi:MAG: cytochrome P450 [Actinomycetota bacterium]